MAKKKKTGFVGTGRMGANMARHLKECGYPITALYDVNKEVAEALAVELGSVHSPTLAGVTKASEVIITVVTDDAAMRKIFKGKKDNLLMGAGRRVFINCAVAAHAISEADIVIAVSGIAGPDGGTEDKPVGTVWLAWLGPRGRANSAVFHFAGDREAVRRQSVVAALNGALKQLADG